MANLKWQKQNRNKQKMINYGISSKLWFKHIIFSYFGKAYTNINHFMLVFFQLLFILFILVQSILFSISMSFPQYHLPLTNNS